MMELQTVSIVTYKYLERSNKEGLVSCALTVASFPHLPRLRVLFTCSMACCKQTVFDPVFDPVFDRLQSASNQNWSWGRSGKDTIFGKVE